MTLKITDEAVAFDAPTVARLTMTIGAEKAIIADVVRDNKMRELKIYDMEGNEIHEIEVGYDNYKPFQVKANFRFAATNRPEWLEIAGNAIVGTVNEMTNGEVKVIENSQYVKYVQNGTLTFADEDGVMSYSFPLVYKGMDPKSIKILDFLSLELGSVTGWQNVYTNKWCREPVLLLQLLLIINLYLIPCKL